VSRAQCRVVAVNPHRLRQVALRQTERLQEFVNQDFAMLAGLCSVVSMFTSPRAVIVSGDLSRNDYTDLP
jgi:hypothetical protein